MQRKIITTGDGSKTIQITDWNEQYHSVHGAIQEALHVFIDKGLRFYCSEFGPKKEIPINILEIGFGTGLNALLSIQESEHMSVSINYTGVEAYPVTTEELAQLQYAETCNIDPKLFFKLHETKWECLEPITAWFSLSKNKMYFQDITFDNEFDIVYFDAFGSRVQPDLWTEDIFLKMYRALQPHGVLVTYSAKGSVKRALQTVGFEIERLVGPPGKRHMLRAIKR